MVCRFLRATVPSFRTRRILIAKQSHRTLAESSPSHGSRGDVPPDLRRVSGRRYHVLAYDRRRRIGAQFDALTRSPLDHLAHIARSVSIFTKNPPTHGAGMHTAAVDIHHVVGVGHGSRVVVWSK